MSETNKSFRIRANVNSNEQFVNVDFTQNYDKLEILSLEINQSNSYRLMNSSTGIVVGRVLANEGFGIPNAKISVFVSYDGNDINSKLWYQYGNSLSKDEDGVKYNLLPVEASDSCQQPVGTLPLKRYVLDNDDIVEVFSKYYKYTTKTNTSGDYMIYGVPVGNQTVHCDVDLSDIGVLSQTPRDMIYQGYDSHLFESPTKFKSDTNLDSLVQIKSMNNSIYVYPFWGDNTDNSYGAAITRCDFNISYKFEPTCVFMGCIVTDTGNNALSKKCVPSKEGGKMSEMVTGLGTIEIIRKTVNNDTEQISVQGNEVIDENGVWCYQIPMNLDYIMTDEYGNTVLSDNPNKGIPTRTRVRFRVSLHENPADGTARKRARYLIPNNPRLVEEDYPKFNENYAVDYEFGSQTKDEDFRDLMWNNVYTVKNYIPRIQKAKLPNNLRFMGIKMVNHSDGNNPIPYNKLSIKFNFMYTFVCILMKVLIQLTRVVNYIIYAFDMVLLRLAHGMIGISNRWFWPKKLIFLAGVNKKTPDQVSKPSDIRLPNGSTTFNWTFPNERQYEGCEDITQIKYTYLQDSDGSNDDSWWDKIKKFLKGGGNNSASNRAAWCCVAYYLKTLCENKTDTNKWHFGTITYKCNIQGLAAYCCALVNAMGNGITLEGMCDDEDGNPLDVTPGPDTTRSEFLKLVINNITCYDVNRNVAELYNCIENQLAQENEVTSFNFYNDWVNGMLYMPLWYRRIRKKRKYLGFITIDAKDQWCNGNETALGSKKRKLKVYSNDVITRTVKSTSELKPLADDYKTVDVENSVANDETGRETMVFKTISDDNCYGYKCHKYGRSETPIVSGLIIEKETILGEHVYYYKPVAKTNVETDLITLFATDIVLLGSLKDCDLHGIPQFFKILEGTSYQMPSDLLNEDYSYLTLSSINSDKNTDENNSKLIDESTRHTENTGADWGNLGIDQSSLKRNDRFEVNENIYDNGGLFYGITCTDSYTKPKSIINLERLCEIGVSLDESFDLPTSQLTADADENSYTSLTPDGYVSYDEIYNHDYRSMFATLNGNFLKTKRNYETGLTEYDLTHVYLDNFDGSLKTIMSGKTTHGNMVVNGVDTGKQANYVNNYKLEESDTNYVNFRFGNYLKKNNKKIYFYDYSKTMTTVEGVEVKSANKIPRYENSFYFYFGLKAGNTAIDRFYKEYYADCATNANYGKNCDITFVGNDWCSGEGGYIMFDSHYDVPVTVTLTSQDDNTIQYISEEIDYNKFFIGYNESSVSGYTHVDVTLDGITVNNIADGGYDISIIDGNGDEHLYEISFYNTNTIDCDVNKYDFNVSNNDLIESHQTQSGNVMYSITNILTGDIVLLTPNEYIEIGSMYDSTQTKGYIPYGKLADDGTGINVFVPYTGYTGYTYNETDEKLYDASGNEVSSAQYQSCDYKDDNGNVLASSYTVNHGSYYSREVTYARGYTNLLATDKISVNIYNSIANEFDELNRSLGGYIIISNISEDDFKITIKPSTDGDLSGFIGCSVTMLNGTLTSTGYGYLGQSSDGEYYFGMPYGNINYSVEVMYLCQDGNETTNIYKTHVMIYEGVLKMFINGIDYDLIRNFKTGWSNTLFSNVSQATFDESNLYGWNDIDNIGLQNYTYPVAPVFGTITSETDFTVTNLNEINDIAWALSDSVTRATSSYYKVSPYKYFGQYIIARDTWTDATKDDITLIEDSDGRQPGDTGYIPTYEGNIVNICDTINSVIENRIELCNIMQGSFRLNSNNALEIEITYSTHSTPVKYLIIEDTSNLAVINNN